MLTRTRENCLKLFTSSCVCVILLSGCSNEESGARGKMQVPVEAALIQHGSIHAIRTFSGSLEASASFLVSPKVSGRIETISVDLGDGVQRGAVVAELDADEYQQDLAQAEADLLVAKANLAQSQSALEIAKRGMERADSLRKRGVTSDADLDVAKSELLVGEASVEVDRAQLNRAEAALASARIRLSYTKVQASWSGGASQRFVAERYLDEGQTVAANTGILRIVDLDRLAGVFYVTEKDYANLQIGQHVAIRTDVYPREMFSGKIERIAPVFQDASRQARVELLVENPGLKLKPGMFIRAEVEVARAEEATIIPAESIVTRSDVQGIFLVSEDGKTVSWHEVQVGLRQGDLVQITDSELSGRVVTLGQQLLEDGAAIRLAGDVNSSMPDPKE